VTHTCPRRGETGMDRDDTPFRGAGSNLDDWYDREGYRVCSYCGSMHPDDLMEAVRNGSEIGPTDKSYKFYVDVPNKTPDKPALVGVSNHDGNAGWRPWSELTREEKRIVKHERGGNAAERKSRFYWFSTRESIHLKFYTGHFGEEAAWEFFRLWRTGEVRWGYPGHPYRPLFLPGVSKATSNELAEALKGWGL
jgi:hypothetical protein